MEIIPIGKNRTLKQRVKKIAIFILRKLAYPENTSLSVFFVNKKKIIELNCQFFKKNKETNVISFPLHAHAPDGKFMLGDIVICYEVAEREAKVAKMGIVERLVELLIHGILHLHGYRDKTQIEWNAMKKKQEQFLNEILKAGLLD